jgi:hypothetical protein
VTIGNNLRDFRLSLSASWRLGCRIGRVAATSTTPTSHGIHSRGAPPLATPVRVHSGQPLLADLGRLLPNSRSRSVLVVQPPRRLTPHTGREYIAIRNQSGFASHPTPHSPAETGLRWRHQLRATPLEEIHPSTAPALLRLILVVVPSLQLQPPPEGADTVAIKDLPPEERQLLRRYTPNPSIRGNRSSARGKARGVRATPRSSRNSCMTRLAWFQLRNSTEADSRCSNRRRRAHRPASRPITPTPHNRGRGRSLRMRCVGACVERDTEASHRRHTTTPERAIAGRWRRPKPPPRLAGQARLGTNRSAEAARKELHTRCGPGAASESRTTKRQVDRSDTRPKPLARLNPKAQTGPVPTSLLPGPKPQR